MRTIKMLLATAALATTIAGTTPRASAIEPASGTESKPAAKPTSERYLSTQELLDMLQKMGYEVTTQDSADRMTTWLSVVINRRELGGEFDLTLVLSPNRKKLWGHVLLADLKPEHEVHSAGLLRLLELNADVGPNHFRVDPKTRQLYMSRCTDNRNLTPAQIKEHIEMLLDSCVKTKAEWQTNKWSNTVKK